MGPRRGLRSPLQVFIVCAVDRVGVVIRSSYIPEYGTSPHPRRRSDEDPGEAWTLHRISSSGNSTSTPGLSLPAPAVLPTFSRNCDFLLSM